MMSQETQIVFDLPDVQSIRLECQRCGAALELNPDAEPRTPTHCPQCKTDWIGSGDSRSEIIPTLMQKLREARQLPKEGSLKIRIMWACIASWRARFSGHMGAMNRQSALQAHTQPVEKTEDIKLTLVDFFPQCARSNDDSVDYKSKGRLSLRNDTGELVVVSGIEWSAGATGLLMQTKPKFATDVFRLEGPYGHRADNWQGNGSSSVRVAVGQVFQLWLGFDLDIARKDIDARTREIRQRFFAKDLGTLSLTVMKSGVAHRWSFSL
jgi:hypothetical protein